MVTRPNELSTNATFEFDALRFAENYRRSVVQGFSHWLKGNVLEVGAGIGQMTALLRGLSEVRRLIALEPDAAFCREMRAAFPEQQIVQGTIEAIGAGHWNAILSVNVLEHIHDDEKELRSYYRLLKPRAGALCLFVPARQEIYSELDKDFGHYRRYDRAGLAALLEAAGFEIIRLDYFNFVGYFAWWLNFKLLRKRQFNAGEVRLFDRLIFPIAHRVEARFSPPVGQSLISLARAKDRG